MNLLTPDDSPRNGNDPRRVQKDSHDLVPDATMTAASLENSVDLLGAVILKTK